MNTNQKKYTAFMESVCKEFNCLNALPALQKGFEALCEAFSDPHDDTERERLNWKFNQHDGRPIDEYNDDISTPEMDATRTNNQTDELVRTAWNNAYYNLKHAKTGVFSTLTKKESLDANNRYVLTMHDDERQLTFILHSDTPYSITVQFKSRPLCAVTIPVSVHSNYAAHLRRILSTCMTSMNNPPTDLDMDDTSSPCEQLLQARGYEVKPCYSA